MLTKLSIKNYALIDQLSLELNKGLTTITGETGAGKSIILGGLGLVLGNRFDTTALMEKDQKCIIEATFDISSYNLEKFFHQKDLDFDTQTIIRRELTPSGKSRAFVNDTPVTLTVLQDLKTKLIDVHSQHETLQLNERAFQYQVLDDLANSHKLVTDYQKHKKKYEISKQELISLQNDIENDKAQQDYHTFLYNELLQSNIEIGKLEQLENEQQRLSHIDLIQQNLIAAHQALNSESTGLTEQLHQVKTALSKIRSYDQIYNDFHTRLNSVYLELEDVSRELALILENEDFSTGDLDLINENIHNYHLLFKKHKVTSEKELIDVRESLGKKVQLISDADKILKDKQSEIEQLEIELLNQARQISNIRQQFIPKFEQKVMEILENLGLKNAVFKIDLQSGETFNAYGIDDIEWLFLANKGGTPAPLKKVASGGELSRVMLAIKSLWAQKAKLPTIIFDEIDSGISGEIALKMADILKNLADYMQVISITHLPQVAAKGTQHYKVYKTSGTKTKTQIKSLNHSERQQEIAEMLGGKTLSRTALNHATELLK